MVSVLQSLVDNPDFILWVNDKAAASQFERIKQQMNPWVGVYIMKSYLI